MILLTPALAGATPLDLEVKDAPPQKPKPVKLSLQRKPAAPTSPMESAPAPPSGPPPTDPVLPAATADKLYSPFPTSLADLEKHVIFRFQLGYGVDEGTAVGADLPADVRTTRFYTLGDAVVGTNGLLTPSLSTYFAAHFFFDQDGAAQFAAVPTVYDATEKGQAFLVRSAYATLTDLGPSWLQPLYIRAGRQYRYGLTIAQFDGITAAYETQPVDVSFFYGRRVALYGPGSDPFGLSLADPGMIGGGSLKLHLASFARVPLVVGVDVLSFDNITNLAGSLGVEVASTTMGVTARVRNGDIADVRAEIRTRLSRTTTILLTWDDRTADDWAYDLVVTGATSGIDDPRRHLLFGESIARERGELRAGTVLFHNMDLVLFGSYARQSSEDVTNSFQPAYVEAGSALSVVFSHGLSAGASLRARAYQRTGNQPGPIPLTDIGELGERNFSEGTFSMKYSLGARRFSAEVEVYGRNYEQQPLGLDEVGDFFAGGRFRVEGWGAEKVRIVGEYELADVPQRISSGLGALQSLRVMAEVTF